MNEHWEEWKELVDFRHARVMQTDNILDEMDVAFVEGAISSEKQAEKLKKIRALAKRLVAVGACAVVGMPSSQRNFFDEPTKKAIQFLVDRFGQTEKVRTLKDIVAVDANLPGCPMNEQKFLDVLNGYLNEFGVT
jgi:coenzyme F420-reducing hydrogenase gamma subunit